MTGREVQVATEAPFDDGGRAEIDMQIATAHRFPRDIKQFQEEAMQMATWDEETAGACVYALKRGDKEITGPSVRLAEIVLSAWGNTHAAAKVAGIDAHHIKAQSVVWDLEKNVRIGWEVLRRITYKDGTRYNDDMITTTGNAAEAIAFRNAAFKVVPKALWKAVETRVREVIAGKGKDAKARTEQLRNMFTAYAQKGVTTKQVLQRVGKRALAELTPEDIVTLRGVWTALQDGMTTIEQEFFTAPATGGTPLPKVGEQLLRKQEAAPPPKPSPPPTAEAVTIEEEDPPQEPPEEPPEEPQPPKPGPEPFWDNPENPFSREPGEDEPEEEVLPDPPPAPRGALAHKGGWPKGKPRKPVAPSEAPPGADLGPSRDGLITEAKRLAQECKAAGAPVVNRPDLEQLSPDDLTRLISRLKNMLQIAKQAQGGV